MFKSHYLAPFAALLITSPVAVAADACSAAGINEMVVSVNTDTVSRAGAPKELFGFNVPWRVFELGYSVPGGSVRPELLALMAPFQGAVYRYPGGTPTNTFEWKKSVGAQASRSGVYTDVGVQVVPQFGLMEFLNFVTAVKGRAIVQANMNGPGKAPGTPESTASDAVEMLKYIKANSSFKCVGGAACPLMGVELGNEQDWTPFLWPAATYTARAQTMIKAVTNAGMPEVYWIAHGRTGPWSDNSYVAFNTRVANDLAKLAPGMAIHPYYDGVAVPTMTRYIDEYYKAWKTVQPNAKIFVTEHARWPTVPAVGDWKVNWYQGAGILGAVSAADFLISLVPNPQVAAANWHALGIYGPWQLIRKNETSGALYPSPTYFGLRTLREAYLDDVVSTLYKSPAALSSYSGGYDFRAVAMTSTDKKTASVLGINRSPNPLRVRIMWSGNVARATGDGVMRLTSSPDKTADNSDAKQDLVKMLTSTQKLTAGRKESSWCVPPQAVFSVVEP